MSSNRALFTVEKCHYDEIAILIILLLVTGFITSLYIVGIMDILSYILTLMIVIPLVADLLNRLNSKCPCDTCGG